MARRRKRPLPPRLLWPRLPRRGPQDRRACPVCGCLDRAVSTRGYITYYGPAKCDSCGNQRPLRKSERPVDYPKLKAEYMIPRDMVCPQ